jgi:Mg2+/Co2+ transporter CorB
MRKNDDYEVMAGFVRQVSRLTQDQECQTCNQPGIDRNSACSDHLAWNMPVDDALDTVNGLILQARALVAALKL